MTRVKLGHRGTGVDMMIYGALITLISIYQPKGVWGFLSGLAGRRHPPAGPARAALAEQPGSR
jgi:hypothetical protein